jgi:flagellar hook-associated protein 2
MSTMRISGLASGMDIDQMVKDLMKAEKMPLDKMKQSKQVLEWQRDDYRSMNTLLLDFRSTLTQMKMTTNYRSRLTTSSDDSKVMATASSSASTSSYSIEQVKQLAIAARKNNLGPLSVDPSKKVDSTKSISSQEISFAKGITWSSGSVESQSITITDPSTPIKLTLSTNTNLKDIPNMSVKVNGKAFNVVTTLPTSPATLADNEVYVSTVGDLTFKTAPLKNDTIKVEFVADKKIESQTTASALTDLQLTKGAISTVNVTYEGVVYTSDSTDSTVKSDGTYNLVNGSNIIGSIDKETGKITFGNGMIASGKSLSVDYTQKYANFSVTTSSSTSEITESFLFQGNESLNSVINEVNASPAGVTMFYDSYSDHISITRNETGDFNKGDLLDPQNLPPGEEIRFTGDFINKTLDFDKAKETGGYDASLIINGLSTTRQSNTFDMNGVTFTLKKTFNETYVPGDVTKPKMDSDVSIAVTNDSTTVFNNIVKFVDTYNKLIDTVNKKVSEERYRDYTPLTDDQRESLSDKQQEQWEEKAKSGLLKRDSTLSSLLTTMRNNFSNPINNDGVSSAYNQLASIGISTTANYLEGGKLVIDEAKLKAAIQADPASVENLFRGDGPTSTQKGVVQRLYDSVSESMDKLKEKAGNSYSTNQQFSIGLQLNSYDSRITSFTSKLTSIENRYYSQFTAMEKAIQKANQQSAYLTNNMGGGQ